jgi:hypothetical protein
VLLTEAQSAKAIGGVSLAVGAVAAVAPASAGKALGATLVTGQDRYLGRQVGLDLAALGAVLLSAPEAQRKAPLRNVVASAAALIGVTVATAKSGGITPSYATRMVVAAAILGAAAALPMI